MDIVFVDDDGKAIVRLDCGYMLCNPLWRSSKGKFTKFSAYCDLVFMADDYGHLRTTIRDLSERWHFSTQTVRYLLKKFRDYGFIITSHDQHYWYISLIFEPTRNWGKYQAKISECRYPDMHGCKGCEYNNAPECYDGGCKLIHNHYPIDK